MSRSDRFCGDKKKVSILGTNRTNDHTRYSGIYKEGYVVRLYTCCEGNRYVGPASELIVMSYLR